ncbi:putative ribonuclease H-like domain-containing protein [Tanacetum coccineum]
MRAMGSRTLLLTTRSFARATSTNIVNTASTLVSTDSPSNAFSTGGPDLNNSDQDDSQIHALEDIYDNPSDGIFTNASYDDEGAVSNFTKFRIHMKCFDPNSHFKIHSIHPTTNSRNPKAAFRQGSKVHKSSGAHAFICLMGRKAIGTKLVYRNKQYERGVVVRNKARLVPQGHRQEEGIDYWMESGYKRGTIDKTLFIKKDKNDIMLVQVYVDDIIFGSTKRSWCDEFEALMKSRF